MTIRSGRRSTGVKRALLAVSGVAAVAGLVGCAAPQSNGPAGVEISGGSSEFVGGQAIGTAVDFPDVNLTDTDGQPFNLTSDATSPVSLVFFGYTNCPDLCGDTLANAASAIRKLDPATQADVQMVFITVDPARDTSEVMAKYLDRFGFPSYVGLTGSLTDIETAAADLNIGLDKHRRLPDGGYEVPHSVEVLGFGADHLAHVFWSDGTPTNDFAQDLAVLAKAS